MEIRLRSTGEVLTDMELKARHPETSFPPVLSKELLAEFDADPVLPAPAPTVARYQHAMRDGVVQDGLGNWVQMWKAENWPVSEIDAYKVRAKATAWEGIKAKRSQVKDGGVQVGGNWFQTDVDSRIQYLGLKDKARDALMAGGSLGTVLYQLGNPIQWKTYANTFVQMTVGLAIEIVQAVSDLDAAAFKQAEVHRAAMQNALDPAAYDYGGGWPATYQG